MPADPDRPIHDEHIHYVPESPAVALPVVVWSAVGSLILVGSVIIGFYALYQSAVPIKALPAPQTFPQPRLQTDAGDATERRRLAAEQTERLNVWRWANDQHTLVQVPIDRAMQLLAQKGADGYAPLLPPQPTLASPSAAAQQATTPNPSSGK
jgi:hypothetical protein